MIEVHNLTKSYNNNSLFSFRRKQEETLAVDNVNLQIEKGQIFGLLGVNGAGKTTTIKMLCTLLEPTSGTATIGGYSVVDDANQVRKIVNMIAGGERMLYWRLTARENLAYFADLYNVDGKIKNKRIDHLLEMVGLNKVANKRVEQFSKGMKQRLQIARGLINAPQYLFLDEPTIGLDAPIARQIRQTIKDELNMTILFTTHYIAEAEELCDQVAIIHRGKIIEQGTPEDLKRAYQEGHISIITIDDQNEILKEKLSKFCQKHNVDISTKVSEEGYQIQVISNQNVSKEMVDIITSSDVNLLELRIVEPSLEDVLVAVYDKEVE